MKYIKQQLKWECLGTKFSMSYGCSLLERINRILTFFFKVKIIKLLQMEFGMFLKNSLLVSNN